ncbi:MAG: hypothetical protein NT051_06035 [Candidatus Micrarchaeota archaeon]|nr:hypothetical protein [Candidatus Micrarchaeota archaeon]
MKNENEVVGMKEMIQKAKPLWQSKKMKLSEFRKLELFEQHELLAKAYDERRDDVYSKKFALEEQREALMMFISYAQDKELRLEKKLKLDKQIEKYDAIKRKIYIEKIEPHEVAAKQIIKNMAKEVEEKYGISVEREERSHYPGGGVGIARYNKIAVTISVPGYCQKTVQGREFQFRDSYSSKNDDYRHYIRDTFVEDVQVDLPKVKFKVKIRGDYGGAWTENFDVELKRSDGAKKKSGDEIRKIALQKAGEILYGIIEMQQEAGISESQRPYVGYHTVEYGDPIFSKQITANGDAGLTADYIVVSSDCKFAVFIVQEMIDHRIESGVQMRWTAYRVTLDGKMAEVAEGHSYERGELGAAISFAGVSDDGIALQTREGIVLVRES